MRNYLLILVLTILHLDVLSQSKTAAPKSKPPSKEAQIKAALLAAPADKRDSATVYGYADNNELVVLREGTNEMICVADDPSQAEFSVACYHKDLHPFMQRGRDLRKMGRTHQQVFDIREKEAKSGEMMLPKQPTTLFVLSAKDADYNKNTGDVKNTYLRYVVYIPYATAASTGLPLKPDAPGMPWIMHPGTHGAHIMINPPETTKK